MNRFTAKGAGHQIAVDLEKLRDQTPAPKAQNPPGHETPIVRPGTVPRQIVLEKPSGPEQVAVRPVSKKPLTPMAKIEKSWKALRQELRRKARSASAESGRDLRQAALSLIDEGLLTPDFGRSYSLLNEVRAIAQKNPDSVSAALADDFRAVCDVLMDHLRQIEN